MCKDCLESIIELHISDDRYLLALYVIRSRRHFHFVRHAGLRNTDGVPTPPQGVPVA